MSDKQQIRLGLVGYGEIGSTLGQGLREAGLQQIASYDKYAFDGPYSALIQARAAAAGVTLVGSPEQLVEAADLIVSVTPGSASLESAEAFAPHLTGQHVFIDIASATPKLKQGVADRLSGTNALLADGSIMGTPKDGFAMPILASGPAAERVRDALVPWGMRIEAVGDVLGTASGIKIIRSVLIKGIEALLDEMLLTARAYGIDDTVLDFRVQDAVAALDGDGEQPDTHRRDPCPAAHRGGGNGGGGGPGRRDRADHDAIDRGASALEGPARHEGAFRGRRPAELQGSG